MASVTMEVKNNHAHVTTQRILNELFEINFSAMSLTETLKCHQPKKIQLSLENMNAHRSIKNEK